MEHIDYLLDRQETGEFQQKQQKLSQNFVGSYTEAVIKILNTYLKVPDNSPSNGKAGVGVIAQEMQEVLPEVVHEGENLSVAYGNIVGVLIEAVKELSARVKELEAK